MRGIVYTGEKAEKMQDRRCSRGATRAIRLRGGRYSTISVNGRLAQTAYFIKTCGFYCRRGAFQVSGVWPPWI